MKTTMYGTKLTFDLIGFVYIYGKLSFDFIFERNDFKLDSTYTIISQDITDLSEEKLYMNFCSIPQKGITCPDC